MPTSPPTEVTTMASNNIRIFHARDFVVATAEGKFDFEKSKKLLMEIAEATAPLSEYGIIIDARKAQPEMSVDDLYNLAVGLANWREAFSRKTAVLCPLEHFDQAAFFALCAQNRNFPVMAFTSFEEAIEWLMA